MKSQICLDVNEASLGIDWNRNSLIFKDRHGDEISVESNCLFQIGDINELGESKYVPREQILTEGDTI